MNEIFIKKEEEEIKWKNQNGDKWDKMNFIF